MFLLFAILAIGLLIIIHELGHFLVARALGMKVDSFSVGFGPALLSFRGRRGETEYRLSMLPLGGYVQIAGMAPGDGTPADEPRSFARRPLIQRFLVIAAGPITNWLFAFLVLSGLFVIGFERAAELPTIGQIADRSPAATAGLQAGDRVTAVGDRPIESWAELVEAIRASKDQPLSLSISRLDRELVVTATPGPDGLLGISATTELVKYPPGKAMVAAVRHTGTAAMNTFTMLGKILRNEGTAQLMGPVGIVNATAAEAQKGVIALMAIMVQVSLALALMNLLPLPGLDGGRLFFMGIEAVRRRPVNPKFEAIAHGVGIALVLALLLVTTFTDLTRSPRSPTRHPAPQEQDRAPQK